ncbi:unnamed protein product, partial [Staurois parvus]
MWGDQRVSCVPCAVLVCASLKAHCFAMGPCAMQSSVQELTESFCLQTVFPFGDPWQSP